MMREFELNEELRRLATSLDITDEMYERVISYYEDAAEWLSKEGSPLREYSPTIYPQGSFRLGTMVRPVRDEDKFDIDLVCRLSIAKERTSQANLKKSVGDRLRASSDFASVLQEQRRCWTLDCADDFYVDVLPAIPDAEGVKDRILLTDRDLRFWQHSNPIGYADWFIDRMGPIQVELREALAKSVGVSVEDVPQWRLRTPLQRAVQLLKRHRDGYFGCDDDGRPVSIIITTLAARAYRQERTIDEALMTITREMPQHIERRGGRWWVENPANAEENFADKWNEKPERRASFVAWLRKVEQDIGLARVAKSGDARREVLRETFGVPPFTPHRGLRESSLLPTVRREDVPALAGSDHIQRVQWPERSTYKCSVRGQVYRALRRGRSLWPLSDRPVPKEYALRFEAITNVPRPYEVHWQVVNTGQDAVTARGLRGGFYMSDGGPGVRWETTIYAGTHWIEAFVVKGGVCLARSGPKYVRIKT